MIDTFAKHGITEEERAEFERAYGFAPVAERIDAEYDDRKNYANKIIPYHNAFLDKVTGGILPGELVLLGGSTGTGKTEMATEIALHAARNGKRVYFFALEASQYEIERRMKYKIISRLYKVNGGQEKYDYKSWLTGEAKELYIFEEAATKIQKKLTGLHTFYKTEKFDLKEFEDRLLLLVGRADLVIVDHIHYFDLADSNENQELSRIIHTIRHLGLSLNIPIIMLAHLRKLRSGDAAPIMPSLGDFHGTSALTKVCTTAILLGKAPEMSPDLNLKPTFIKVDKSRTGGNRTDIACVINFNPESGTYDPEWEPGVFDQQRTKFYQLTEDKFPEWLKAKRKQPQQQELSKKT